MKKVRIGIDVGGTFTHAVAIDNKTLEIIAYAVTPTTHNAKEGVSAGVVEVFDDIKAKLDKSCEIIFIAHSTTQATNALLEGDVAKVGIIATGHGAEGLKVKIDADIPQIEVSPKKYISSSFFFVDSEENFKNDVVKSLEDCKKNNCDCIVAAAPFSVDDPTKEILIKEQASIKGFQSCGTHEMSGLYGLRARTKTAVINASILPKMVETANMTEKGLAKGNNSNLMVMRSDGGVMSIDEMRKRPLLTLLSGPAAGIAAALAYVRATDAIFLETGGTSTDITAIKSGRSMIRSAVIGGHITYMKTLDCRTVGIAGGSMVKVKNNKIESVGPRSAHIAGLPYLAFTSIEKLGNNLKPILIKPLDNDSDEYLALENEKGDKFAITLTCASNLLGYVTEKDYAFGNLDSIKKGFKSLEKFFNKTSENIAHDIMKKASKPVCDVVTELLKDYDFEGRKVILIGGGGGTSAVVPYVAETMKMEYKTSEHSEVVSAIGAAMAMIRETVEKNIFNPTPKDIEDVKKSAQDAVIKMGAVPESVDVLVEVDSQKNIVRAVASGSIEFQSRDLAQDLKPEEIDETVKKYFGTENISSELLFKNDFYRIYKITKISKVFFGLFSAKKILIAIVDSKGTIRQQIPNGSFYETDKKTASNKITEILEKHREYGDAGAITKGIFVVVKHKIFDYSSIGAEDRILSMVNKELEEFSDEEKISVIAL